MPPLATIFLQDRPEPEPPECPICGLDEEAWDHEACEEAQQIEPYRPGG